MPPARRAYGSDETALRKPFQGESVRSQNDDRCESGTWGKLVFAPFRYPCERARLCELMSFGIGITENNFSRRPVYTMACVSRGL